VFSFIAAEKTNYPVAVMCRVFGVNRTGFHNWERRAPSDRALQDAWLTERIKQIHDASRGVYGAPRIHAELRLEHGVRVGRKRVARLMKAAGIAGVRPRKRWRTTIRIPGITPATDLVERQFRPTSPNVLWVADMTCLRTGEGWLYLAAVQDAHSRQIVGWSMATHMRASLVVDALQMALQRRRPGPGLIHHSDQGSQYVSLAFGRAAGQAGIAVSMGSRGDAYDNAVAETFFATLKKELVNRRSWPSRPGLQSAVFEYIEAFYNRRRRHSTLGMVSPAEYEQTQTNGNINQDQTTNDLTTPVSSETGQVRGSSQRLRTGERNSAQDGGRVRRRSAASHGKLKRAA
jgi:putative transposase